jgi:hypothetical protein
MHGIFTKIGKRQELVTRVAGYLVETKRMIAERDNSSRFGQL